MLDVAMFQDKSRAKSPQEQLTTKWKVHLYRSQRTATNCQRIKDITELPFSAPAARCRSVTFHLSGNMLQSVHLKKQHSFPSKCPMRIGTNCMHDVSPLTPKGLERSICAWQSCYLVYCEGILVLTGLLSLCLEQNRLPSLWILALVKETQMKWLAMVPGSYCTAKNKVSMELNCCVSVTLTRHIGVIFTLKQVSFILLKVYLVLATLQMHFSFGQLLNNIEDFSQLRDLFLKKSDI